MVFARRMKAGNTPIALARESFSLPIAVVVVARWSISPARSSRLAATSVTSFEELTTKSRSSGVSRLSSEKRRLEAASEGFR